MDFLSPDTQATLLLVGRFTKSTSPRPLTNAQYRRVAEALHSQNLRPADLLREVPNNLGVETERITELLGRGTALALAMERWGQLGIKVIGRSDIHYPQRLRARLKGAAAPILFAAGSISLLERAAVCIVGSRSASESGLSFATELGVRCAQENMVVVSGDAKGVDRAAMNGALDHGGAVVAVLSDSLGKAVLAKRNRDAILDGRLALVSPYSPDAPFTVAQAMDRNKYLYAMAIGAVIVESDTKGGTWNGAIENARRGWVPALVRGGENSAAGNRALISRGIMPIIALPDGNGETLASLIVNSASKTTRPQFEKPSGYKENSIRDDVVYSVFRDQLRIWLAVSPQTTEAIAARFDMMVPQVMRWLARVSDAEVIEQLDGCHWSLREPEKNDPQSNLLL